MAMLSLKMFYCLVIGFGLKEKSDITGEALPNNLSVNQFSSTGQITCGCAGSSPAGEERMS